MKYKILVIGESCRDIFNYGRCTRLCPDAPAPVVNSLKVLENPGMAANVQNNILVMGGDAEIYTNDNWRNITKTRFIEITGNYIFMRLDDEKGGYGKADVKKIEYHKYAAIIISDYDKGFLSEGDISYISKAHPLVFLDTKKKLGEWCENVLFIKINNHEYKQSKDNLNNKIKEKLITTLGPKGCRYQDKIYPVSKVEIKDLSGAGDTFLSGLVYKYMETENIHQAINFANECSTVVVQKRGVSTI